MRMRINKIVTLLTLSESIFFVGATVSDGSICVDSYLVDMFELINELRDTTTSSTIYTALDDTLTEVTSNGYFTLQDGTQIYLDFASSQISHVMDYISD